MKLKIISGGQTGADLAGLWVAKLIGLPTGGLAPDGYLTLDGKQPGLKYLFGLQAEGSYPSRTVKNVKAADVTLVFSRDMKSAGTVLTLNSAEKAKKDFFPIPDQRTLGEDITRYWAKSYRRHPVVKYLLAKDTAQKKLGLDEEFTINVAGNATKNAPEAFEFAFVGLWKLLEAFFHERFLLLEDRPVVSVDTKFLSKMGDLAPRNSALMELALKHKDKFEVNPYE